MDEPSKRPLSSWALLGSYKTPKIVKIKDPRLGCVECTFLSLTAIFIFGYQLLYKNEHFRMKDVYGNAQLSIQQPTQDHCNPNHPDCYSDFTPLTRLPYCDVYNGSSTLVPEGKRLGCVFADEFTLRPDGTLGAGVMVPTRIESVEQERFCKPAEENGYTCLNEFQHTSERIPVFVADIEKYTLLFSHSYNRAHIRGTNNHLMGHYMQCIPESEIGLVAWAKEFFFGQKDCRAGMRRVPIKCLEDGCRGQKTGSTADGEDGVFAIRDGDVFSISKLLEIADVSLDRPDESLEGGSLRSSGGVLDVRILYNNIHPFRSFFGDTSVEYEYRITMQPLHQLQNERVARSPDKDRRVIEKRHGIFVSMQVAGEFGIFSVANLLLVLTTAGALFAVSKVLTDHIALYIMKRRDRYHDHKFDNVEIEESESSETS